MGSFLSVTGTLRLENNFTSERKSERDGISGAKVEAIILESNESCCCTDEDELVTTKNLRISLAE